MKRIAVIILLVTLFLTTTDSLTYSADKVVVIPLNSSSSPVVAGTEITTLPYNITNPGLYFITKDLTCAAGSHGITVNADNVTLDLMGFSLIGPGGAAANFNTDAGIYLGNKENIEIRNGTVTNFAGSGILDKNDVTDGGAKGARIINIRVTNNAFNGISLQQSTGVIVDSATVLTNGNYGVYVNNGIVKNCISSNNGNGGYWVNNSVVSDNTASKNTGNGFLVALSSVTNNVSYNNSGKGFAFALANLVEQNTALENATANFGSCTGCVYGNNFAP